MHFSVAAFSEMAEFIFMEKKTAPKQKVTWRLPHSRRCGKLGSSRKWDFLVGSASALPGPALPFPLFQGVTPAVDVFPSSSFESLNLTGLRARRLSLRRLFCTHVHGMGGFGDLASPGCPRALAWQGWSPGSLPSCRQIGSASSPYFPQNRLKNVYCHSRS